MADLTTVKYIGESTSEELRRRLGSSRPTSRLGDSVSVDEAARNQQIARFVLDARQQRQLAKVSSFMPERGARKSTEPTGESRAEAGVIRRGDFELNRSDFKKAREQHDARPETSQELDEDKRARITTDFARWSSDPDSFDFPGIDTPSRRSPRREDKDKGFVDSESLLRPFDGDEEEGEGQEESGLFF